MKWVETNVEIGLQLGLHYLQPRDVESLSYPSGLPTVGSVWF